MKQSRIFFLSLMTISTLVLVVATYLLRPQPSANDVNASYQGTDLGSVSASDFRLVDQTGTTLSLQKFRGHPVVLTFLYTHCPGPCPLLAEKLRLAAEQLGEQANQVTWLAVSLDAKGDTKDSATAFVETHHLNGRLHYLLGSHAELEPIWKAYHIGVQSLLETPGASTVSIMHTSGLFLLDQRGRERLYLDGSFDPALLRTQVHALLAG
jgi:protein SCO1/2